jgi:hypothetical protein
LRPQKKELDQTVADIAAVDQQMVEMKSTRTEENAAFQHAKKDDDDAVTLLSLALDMLSKYYKDNGIKMGPVEASVKGAAVFQQQDPEFTVSEWQAPDADFSGKGARKGETKGVVSIMTMLIEDLKDEISNGIKNEEEAQTQFDTEYAAAEKMKEGLTQRKLSLETAIGETEDLKVAEQKDKSENTADKVEQLDYQKKITPDCSFMIEAFEERAKKRAAEVSGLTDAKSFLAGQSTSTAMVQKTGGRSDRFLGM